MSNHKRVRHIWQYGKKYVGLFLIAELCIVVLYAVAVLLPLNLTFLTDEVLSAGKHELIWTAIRNYVVLFAVSCIFNIIYAFAWQILSNQYVGDVKIGVFERIVHAKANWLSSVSSGDLMTRIDTDSDQFLNAIQRNLFHVVNSVVMCLSIVGIVWWIHPTVAIMLVVAAVLPIVLTRALGSVVQRVARQEAKTNGAFQGRLFEILKSMKDIRLMSAQKWADRQICLFMQKLIKLRNRLKWLDFSTDKFILFVNLITTIVIYFYCATLVGNGIMTVGVFLALLQYITLLHRKLNWILRLYLEWFGRKAGLDRVIEILELQGEKHSATAVKPADDEVETISFRNVCMKYDRNEVLRNISFDIHKGEWVAIVGYSGSGKTTIADLIVGLYQPTGGAVYINGVNVSEYSPNVLRRRIAVLNQQIALFGMTLRDNLLIGCPGDAVYTDNELLSLCDSLDLGECIRSAPNGLDSIPGIAGFDLSGGQKQRLMIARVLLRKPEVLILDEATSALDVMTELKVMGILREWNPNTTVLVISHRKETVECCDRAIVIHQGVQITEGTHTSLLTECTLYHKMFGDKENEIIKNTDS